MHVKIDRRTLLGLSLYPVVARAARAASNTEPIVIGGCFSLTSDFAIAGIEQKNGAVMAVNAINATGGIPGAGGNRQIKLMLEDISNSPTTAVNAVTKVLGYNPVGILMTLRGTQVLPCLPLLDKAGVPGLTISGTASVTGKGSNEIFRFYVNDDVSKAVLVKFVVEELKKKKPAILYSTEEYGTSGRDHIVEALKKFNITPVAVEGHQPSDKDFTAQLQKIRVADADIIFLQSTEAPEIIILRQAYQMGLGIRFALAATAVEASVLKQLSAPEIEGQYAESLVVEPEDSKSEVMRAWAKQFKNEYHTDADLNSVLTTDMTNMLVKAISVGGPKPSAVTKALHSISYKGLATTYQSAQNGDMVHEAIVVKVTKEKKLVSVYNTKVPFKPYMPT